MVSGARFCFEVLGFFVSLFVVGVVFWLVFFFFLVRFFFVVGWGGFFFFLLFCCYLGGLVVFVGFLVFSTMFAVFVYNICYPCHCIWETHSSVACSVASVYV